MLVDESGRLLRRSVQRGPKATPGWRDLTREEDELTMAFPDSFLYPSDGPIVQLKTVEILVSTDRMVADGIEEAAVQVRGDIIDTVGVKIGADRYELDGDDMVLLKADVPGVFQVALDDLRYWAAKQNYIIAVVAPSEETT